eukprot:gene5884-11882_t
MKLLLILLLSVSIWFDEVHPTLFSDSFDKALIALEQKDYIGCEKNLLIAVKINPNNADVTQLLGSVQLSLSKVHDAVKHLGIATQLSNGKNPEILANYIEALRAAGDLTTASSLGHKGIVQFPTDDRLLYNLAKIELERQNHDTGYQLLEQVIKLNPLFTKAWSNLIDYVIDNREYDKAEQLVLQALQQLSRDADIIFRAGIIKHYLNLFHEAIEYYNKALTIDPQFHMVYINMGAAYQALGQAETAIRYYEAVLPYVPGDKGLLNNYGSLLGIMGRHVEEIQYLKKALDLDPNMESALINLGSFHQDEGDLQEARNMFSRAAANNPNPVLRLRIALMESPVADSWSSMLQERKLMKSNVISVLNMTSPPGILHSYIDRIHFYIVYPGINDRPLQCLISQSYQKFVANLTFIVPHLNTTASTTTAITAPSSRSLAMSSASLTSIWNRDRDGDKSASSSISSDNGNGNNGLSTDSVLSVGKVRVGFVSKYFGIFEPHGLLLDGVMRYLPRSQFQVFVFPVARTDGKPLSPSIAESASEIHEVSLSLEHASALFARMKLDILVFADVLSEPMNHFLAYSRLAPVQVAFWGNPVTSCSPHMDYFVSADGMEYPFRNRLTPTADPYAEQVVLLEGQGIWYFKPEDLAKQLEKTALKGRVGPDVNFTRADFGLNEDWFVYFCPQSVFKMHPLFDGVFADILTANPNGHIVITGGRRQRWSDVYSRRLNFALGPILGDRMHMIPRVSSEKFPALLRLADIILHPFPFDGSRTALDSLEAGKPFVTLPSEYLRGRMGVQYYRTMNIPELVAKNRTVTTTTSSSSSFSSSHSYFRSDYVSIAVKLGRDFVFKNQVTEKILTRRRLLWEDMDVPFEWTRFLSRIAGIPVTNWKEFISTTGRDVQAETMLRDTRQKNYESFEKAWGPESWMRGRGREEVLVEDLEEGEVPLIFRDWQWDSRDQGRGQGRGLNTPSVNPAVPKIDNSIRSAHMGGGGGGGSVRSADIHAQHSILPTTADKDNKLLSLLIPVDKLIDERQYERAYELALYNLKIIDGSGNGHDDPSLASFQKDEKTTSTMMSIKSALSLRLARIQLKRGQFTDALWRCTNHLTRHAESITAHVCTATAAAALDQEDIALAALHQASTLIQNTTTNITSGDGSIEFGEDYTVSVKELFEIVAAINSSSSTMVTDFVSALLDLDLPPLTTDRGGGKGVIILLLLLSSSSPSNVHWDASLGSDYKRLQKALSNNKINFNMNSIPSLVTEIRRIRQHFHDNVLLDILVYSIMSVLNADDVDVLSSYINTLQQDISVQQKNQKQYKDKSDVKKRDVVLLTQYSISEDIGTQRNQDLALLRNTANPYISKIILLTEDMYDFSPFPMSQQQKGKIEQFLINRKMTYRDGLEFANEMFITDNTTAANAAHRRFSSRTGDLPALIHMWEAWTKSPRNKTWANDNFLSLRALQHASSVRDQLWDLLRVAGQQLPQQSQSQGGGVEEKLQSQLQQPSSCLPEWDPFLRCMASSLHLNVAKREETGGTGGGGGGSKTAGGLQLMGGATAPYKTLRGGLPVHLHPSSFLNAIHNRSSLPQFVIFTELLVTTKNYIHNVTAIEANWLTELHPTLIKAANAPASNSCKEEVLR